jgi:serine/threonine protein kinase
MRKPRGRARPAEGAVFDPDQPPDIPDVVGLTRIGGGANSTVYRGTERGLQRPVAVKILHAPVRDPEGRRSFEVECALAGQVGEHEYAAEIYRRGFAADHPFIVMHYYAHGSLADRLKTGRPLDVPEVLTTGIHIACALQFAHDLGILHRDIKPANILSDGFGNSVLSDFGIAAARDLATRQLRYAMTPAFAAPEVVEQGGGWPASDVWSLAATLYALLAGYPPFFGPGAADTGPRANLQALAGPLPPIGRGVPGHVQETLARALIGRPDHRTGSARRLAEELNADERLLGLTPTPLQVAPLGPAPGAAPAGAAGMSPPRESMAETGTMDPGLGHRAPASPPEPHAPPPAAPEPAPFTPARETFLPATETGMVPPGHSYLVPEGPAEPATRRRPATALIAAGGAVALVIVVAVAFAVLHHRKAGANAGTGTPPSSGASSTAAPAGSGLLPPPADVRATPVGHSAVRIAWKDAEPRGRYPVVISLGTGYPLRAVRDRSPQVISGLAPSKPYCFAVGYVYSMEGKTVYSSPPVCINGGTPSAGG